MCKNSNNLSIRLECIIWAIAEIVLCVTCIGFVCCEGRYGVLRSILLGALSLGTLAGFCLLLGAVLRKHPLVLVWTLLACPVVFIVVVIICLILHKSWYYITDYEKARKIIGMILVIIWTLYMVYLSWLLVRELKTGEMQKRYPDCIGGRYPRGALRERQRPN